MRAQFDETDIGFWCIYARATLPIGSGVDEGSERTSERSERNERTDERTDLSRQIEAANEHLLHLDGMLVVDERWALPRARAGH